MPSKENQELSSMSETESAGGSRWVALESNPEVWSRYMYKMGMSEDWAFGDVLGLDEGLLMMVPQPVVAVILLFPISDKMKTAEKAQQEQIAKDGNEVNPEVYFLKQYVANACGTIGLLHSVLNNEGTISLKPESPLKNFLNKTKEMNPEDRGHTLEEDKDFQQGHEQSSQEGQTEAPPASESVNPHFIALVHNNGSLYELDGRKDFPINHGKTSPDSLLQDAAKVCKKFMDIDPSELRFTVMALSKK